MLLLLFPTKIIPPPCTQGLSRSFAVYDTSAVLECKDTKKFVMFLFSKIASTFHEHARDADR